MSNQKRIKPPSNPEYWEDRLVDRFRKVFNVEEELAHSYAIAYTEIANDYQRLMLPFLKVDGSLDYQKFEIAIRDKSSLGHTAARYHDLLERIDDITNGLGKQEVQVIEQLLMNTYKENYYQTLWMTEQGLGYKTQFTLLSQKRLEQVIHTRWSYDGKEFSSRIWKQKWKLNRQLRALIKDGIATGKSPLQTANLLHKEMGGKLSNSKRIVRTETMAIITESDAAAYKEIGFEQYYILSTFDSRTSEICEEMDGRLFPLADMIIGTNAPPFHPNCRSTTEPQIPETTKIRYAKDKDGKRVQIPTNMSYADFKIQHLINN